jgi:hypothetical protein
MFANAKSSRNTARKCQQILCSINQPLKNIENNVITENAGKAALYTGIALA